MSKSIVMATPATEELEPEAKPLPPAWVLSGTPATRTKNLARSHDWTSNMVIWECAGSFNWHYTKDEVLVVISGEAFITHGNVEERRLGPGDFDFFPRGTSCTWRVPSGVRKVAFLRETMWRPLGICLKVWSKFLRVVGLGGKSPLMLALTAWASWTLR